MQLSKRLRSLADMVTRGRIVADVGCDHAYVSIYLLEKQIAKGVIAMDINKGPLKKAQENIDMHDLTERIETRLSNGLEKLEAGEVDTILIAGMGGPLIVSILEARPDVVEQCKEMILSPHSEIELVRAYLRTHNFAITEENMIKEDGKYYMMVKAIREEMSSINEVNEIYDRYGKYLLEHKNPVLNEYLHVELTKREKILAQLQKNSSEYQKRILELEHDIHILKGGIEFYDL